MAYSDWDEPFQDLYDSTPGTAYLEAYESGHVEELFEAGFTHHSDEYDALGLTADDIMAIREEFFDYLGLDGSDFDWDAWREAMDYD